MSQLTHAADHRQGWKAAERRGEHRALMRRAIAGNPLRADDVSVPVTVSIGLAEGTLSMSGVDALVKMIDEARRWRIFRSCMHLEIRSIVIGGWPAVCFLASPINRAKF
jgi:hypothetical protein